MIENYFYKEDEITFRIFYDYFKVIKKECSNVYLVKFINYAVVKFLKSTSEKDFFMYKNDLMDLVMFHIVETSDKRRLIEEIKNKILEYNNKKKEEEDVKKEVFKLKKETSIKNQIFNRMTINKEKKLIIKSI